MGKHRKKTQQYTQSTPTSGRPSRNPQKPQRYREDSDDNRQPLTRHDKTHNITPEQDNSRTLHASQHDFQQLIARLTHIESQLAGQSNTSGNSNPQPTASTSTDGATSTAKNASHTSNNQVGRRPKTTKGGNTNPKSRNKKDSNTNHGDDDDITDILTALSDDTHHNTDQQSDKESSSDDADDDDRKQRKCTKKQKINHDKRKKGPQPKRIFNKGKQHHHKSFSDDTDNDSSDGQQKCTRKQHNTPTACRLTHQKRTRKPVTSSSDSGEESYFSSSDNDYDFDKYDIPTTTFGSLIGMGVSDNLRKKILNNKFIELSLLLPLYTHQDTDEFVLKKGLHESPKFVKNKPNRNITIAQWNEAFDIFISIHIECARTHSEVIKLTKALLTYRKEINNMKRLGYDWANYDRHFRTEREATICPWATTRQDLLLHYQHNNRDTFRPYNRNFNQTTAKKPLRTKDGNSIPFGYCLSYHSINDRCNNKQCGFKHQCPRCQQNHPIFRPCHTFQRKESQYKPQYKPSMSTTQK